MDTEDAGNVGMVERGQHAGFAIEASQAILVGGKVRGENLDGDVASERCVGRFPDDSHAALTQLFAEVVVE